MRALSGYSDSVDALTRPVGSAGFDNWNRPAHTELEHNVSSLAWSAARVVSTELAGKRPLVASGTLHVGSLSKMEARLLLVLTKADTDFLKIATIADRAGVGEEVARLILEHSRLFRRPVGARPSEADLYRLDSQGLTWRERLRIARAMIGKKPLDPT